MARKSEQPSVADLMDFEQDKSPADGWRPMDELVDVEGPVVLTADRKTGQIAKWRLSREFVSGPGGRGGGFQKVGFWAAGLSGGQRIPWEPVGWRPYEEERPYAPPAA